MDFQAKYLEIEPKELIRYILAETGQYERTAVNPADILNFLKLEYASFDFDNTLPQDARIENSKPRALLSYPDRVVAVDSNLSDMRRRFSVLHEIAHYVLPSHEYSLYLCDSQGLGFSAKLFFEKEANVFAADLLFCGERFTFEVNSNPISASTVKQLADGYRASFEATSRRLVEKNVRPCMFIVFRRPPTRNSIDLDAEPVWEKKYCIASPRFSAEYFTDLQRAVVPEPIARDLAEPGRDIANSINCQVGVNTTEGKRSLFNAEFFFNQYNIFCFLKPSEN